MDAGELDALIDRLVAEYADRVAAGRGEQLDDLLAQAPAERRIDLRRLLELVQVGGGDGAPRHAPKPLGPGVELGGCRILGELGRGGMATVYRAEQKALKREVALKVLRPGLALDPRQAERFRREALAIARVDHQNLVKVHDVGAEHGHLFLVMELVAGGNLAGALAKMPPAAKRTGADFRRAIGLAGGEAVATDDPKNPGASFEVEVARFFAIVARAIAAAHARSIVHRDLKPSNILLRRDGTPVVADFGLAKGDGDLGFTLTGEPLGTPYYMSPEQVEQASSRVDARTDVWSLGVTLYEVLAGRRPFEGPTTIAVFDAIRRELPRPLRSANPSLSRAAEAVVARAMAREPDDRYASAEELAADLDALAVGKAVRAAPYRHGGGFAFRIGWVASGRFGKSFEYKSATTFLGLPLVHVNQSRSMRLSEMRVAKGWLAIGDRAYGVIAIGQHAFGLIATGGLAVGGFACGGLGIGVVSFAGLALGILAFGGIAAGLVAVGGCAIGAIALGGKALGSATFDGHGLSEQAIAIWDRWLREPVGWISSSLRDAIDRARAR